MDKRAVVSAVCGALFSAQFVALDLLAPGHVALSSQPRRLLGYVGSIALCAALWLLAERRIAKAALAMLTGLVLAVQLLALQHFGTSLDVQFVRSAMASWSDVKPALMPVVTTLLVGTAVVSGVQGVLISPSRGCQRKWAAAAALVAFVGVGMGPSLDRGTPELRLLAALRGIAGSADGDVRGVVRLPPIHSTKEVAPSVLFVLT